MDSIFNNIVNSWKNSYINHNFIENQQNDIFTINDKDDIHKIIDGFDSMYGKFSLKKI